MKRAGIIVVLLILGTSASASAESRPIEKLPSDVMRASMIWTQIPQQIHEVQLDHGPFVALTMGPAAGAAAIVETTTHEVWEATKPPRKTGRREYRRNGSNPKGPIFRYVF